MSEEDEDVIDGELLHENININRLSPDDDAGPYWHTPSCLTHENVTTAMGAAVVDGSMDGGTAD